MNKKLFATLTAGIFAALSISLFSCSGEVIEQGDSGNNDPIQTTAQLTVITQDIINGQVIDSVRVILLSTNDTLYTKTGGIAVFEGVRTGAHQLLLEKAGYAEVITGAFIDVEAGFGILVAQNATVRPKLAPLTSTLIGHVYYQDKNSKEQPAAGVAVRLQLDDYYRDGSYNEYYYVNRVFNYTTDSATGKYTFANLPANAGYDLYALATKIDSITYTNTRLDRPTLIAGSTAFTTKNTLQVNNGQSLFSVLNYSNNVIQDSARKSAVTFIFTEDIDSARFTNSMVRVCYNGQTTCDINSTYYAVSNVRVNKDSIIITPADQWKENFTVTFTTALRSVNGKTFSSSSSHNITVRLKDLSGLRITGFKVADTTDVASCTHNKGESTCRVNYNDRTVYLKWNRLDNLSSSITYTIYGKVDGEKQDAYEYIDQWTPTAEVGKDTVVRSVSVPTSAISSRTARFIIQASNADSRTPLYEADTVVIRDTRKPYVSGGIGSQISPDSVIYFNTNYNYTSSTFASYLGTMLQATVADTLENYNSNYHNQITFSEPMDTTIKVTPAACVAVDAGNSVAVTRLKMKAVWTDETHLDLGVYVDAGAAIAAVNLNAKCAVDLNGLKDKSQKNPLETVEVKYNLPSLPETPSVARTRTVNVLEYRFVTNIVFP